MYTAGQRQRKAYFTAMRVALSYFSLYILSKFRGNAYWDKRIRQKNKKNAERIKILMLDLQGLFIKFGQLVSTLSNALPDEFRKPLEALQDKVPVNEVQGIQQLIERELGHPIHQLFDEFDTKPIAAASIGQVHRARLDGQELVVKVQHPRIDEITAVDLQVIKRISSWVARFFDIKGIEHLYQQIRKMIEEELDYRVEAASIEKIRHNLQDFSVVYVPDVYPLLSSKKVLTLEYCEGVKISAVQQIEQWGLNRDKLAQELIRVYCHMILKDGFYHADPHPGNVLVNQEGEIVFLDFGAVGTLSQEMKDGIPQLIESALKKDSRQIVEILMRLQFINPGEESQEIAERLVDIMQDFVYNELELQDLNLQEVKPEQLLKLLSKIKLREVAKISQIPKDWVLLHRATALLGGLSFSLSPSLNPIKVVQPFLRTELLQRDRQILSGIYSFLKRSFKNNRSIPRELRLFLEKANKGAIATEDKKMLREVRALRQLGERFFYLTSTIAAFAFYLQVEGFSSPQLHWGLAILTGLSFLGLVRQLLK